jgi:AraC family transcriptional regulator
MKDSLIVDYSQKDDPLKIFPFEPLLSTKKNKDRDILVEHYEFPPHQVPDHIPMQDAIVIFHEPASVKWNIGDERKNDNIKAGDIVISPADISHTSSWDEKVSLTLLLFKPDFITHSAYELIDPDRVQVLPRFAQSDPVIYGITQGFKSQLESCGYIEDWYMDSAGVFLADHLRARHCSREHKLPENAYSLSNSQQEYVIDYIQSHLHQDLRVEQLANLLGMSRSHFTRLFTESAGVAPGRYVMECRVQEATRLLKKTSLSVEVIALRTGFFSHSHLCKTFKRSSLPNPDQYRKIL